MALKNEDLNGEVWAIIRDQHWSMVDLAGRLGIPSSNLYRILARDQFREVFVRLVDILGYDIEVKFTRKRGIKN